MTPSDQTRLDAQLYRLHLHHIQSSCASKIFSRRRNQSSTRPIYHKTDATIRGHVFCSFMALVVRKALDDRLLAVAQTERELVPLVEAMTLVDEVAGAVVARVNAIPARFTRNIEQRAALQREVDEALAEVADCIETLGATFQSGRDDPAADEEEAT